MLKQPTIKTPRRTAEVADRDYYRNLPGEMGEVHRAVWGRDETEFEYALEREQANSPPRRHVFQSKVRPRWK